MDEQTWDVTTDAAAMLTYLDYCHGWITPPQTVLDVLSSQRRLRLIGCGLCRLAWSCLQAMGRGAVIANEHYADGLVTAAPLRSSGDITGHLGYEHLRLRNLFAIRHEILRRCIPGPAGVLRDVVGNPWRPYDWVDRDGHPVIWPEKKAGQPTGDIFRIPPRWLTATVRSVADNAYTGRDWESLPVLADALEDAGCDAVPILEHLRGPGPHCLGCWALDIVLGKR